jgi:hypothetical protein
MRSGAGRDGRARITGDEAGDRGHVPKPCAAATATIRSTNPIGISHKRLNHLLDPILIRGGTPDASGSDPDHRSGSMASSPLVSRSR